MATPKKRRGRSHKEQGIQGKAVVEAFQPRDWLSANDLHQAPPMAWGIWIECLSVMWLERVATIKGKSDALAKSLRISETDLLEFCQHATTHGFADVEITADDGPVRDLSPLLSRLCPENVPPLVPDLSGTCRQQCRIFVAITCRRLLRRLQVQEKKRLAKQAEREKKAAQRACRQNVATNVATKNSTSSSSPSSSPSWDMEEEGKVEGKSTKTPTTKAASATACPTGQSRTATTAKPQPAPGPVDRLAKLITAEPHKLSLDDRKQLSLLAMVHEGKLDAVIASHNGSGPITISRLRQLLEAQP